MLRCVSGRTCRMRLRRRASCRRSRERRSAADRRPARKTGAASGLRRADRAQNGGGKIYQPDGGLKRMDGKKTIFSGIQPSGILTLRELSWSGKNWVALQDEYDCYYCGGPSRDHRAAGSATLRRAHAGHHGYINCSGIDPKKNVLYMQSHVSATRSLRGF